MDQELDLLSQLVTVADVAERRASAAGKGAAENDQVRQQAFRCIEQLVKLGINLTVIDDDGIQREATGSGSSGKTQPYPGMIILNKTARDIIPAERIFVKPDFFRD
ncbi:MAG TPA: hypothetical protein VI873_04580 [Candidatus Peribacteraceae bacterium]|nr:hypothetical protein [Candidatus Peribacteraceae bacterium]